MKIALNNISVYYSEYGSSNKLHVVFIHGFPFSHKMWEPQIQVLPDKIHAIVYDVRGHGSSDVSDGQFTIEHFVDDLFALLDRLNIEKTVLCGLSMGGYIALRALEKSPTRVNGLILCDTKSESDSNEAKIKRANTITAIKKAGVQTFAEEFVKSIFWEKTFETNPATVEFIKQIIAANSPLGICGTLLALASRTDTTHVLSTIAIPTCIVVGEHDKLTPPSAAQIMHNLIARSELHILPGAAHMSNLENTEEFNKILAAFLKKHW